MSKKNDEPYNIDAWSTITEDDLKFLANLKEFLDKKREQELIRIQFHRKVWDAALDETGEDFLGCVTKS